jgi:uncharacterized pyridoxamine 5'-phosphate oxidase family protein
MSKIAAFLAEYKPFYIATSDGDQPRVRPFGASVLLNDRLYIVTGSQKAVSTQLKANPKIEISATAPDGKWLRLTAEAALDTDPDTRQAILDTLPNVKALYKDHLELLETYYLKNATATIQGHDGTKESYTL